MSPNTFVSPAFSWASFYLDSRSNVQSYWCFAQQIPAGIISLPAGQEQVSSRCEVSMLLTIRPFLFLYIHIRIGTHGEIRASNRVMLSILRRIVLNGP